ncbi:phenol soluble modulin [Staphylococcus equorum]|uniref:Beta-class phenol-soluble modulin n=1 Tax=Staphylococcus equorum TaxID=246432 RepID=A0AAW7AIS2_9STAP|nr:beta-class phenol-soluble modulin [Staphylococcus equorum]MDG0821422.1 beta-class phenol-soluble modulin [Staphylococcus equorum]MDG0837737.1 beta-class phenol-soluble modulin [Staphylococcus equorum]MDK9865124.1 beta-class phenol-soluble modulin [Staphylococcus equorum]MDK9870408.1 beta-class phenol-soluble modulin [Staphylococcus equorum]MDK9878361.1 beta-class phenol-soluble modulin [Staphylococcus equorum]
MSDLFNAIKETVQAGIAGDGVKLGTSIVDIVSSSVGLLGQLFGF